MTSERENERERERESETFAIVPLAGLGVLVHKLAAKSSILTVLDYILWGENNEAHEKPAEVARQAKYRNELHSTVTA